jgi:hypothetical protein
MTWQIALALTVVVAGACITSVYHIRSTNFNDGAIMGIVLVLLSTGMYEYTHTHVCVCVCVCVYYIERERDRE